MQFRYGVHHDVSIARIVLDEMLVVSLGRIERLQRNNLSGDRGGEDVRLGKLLDVSIGDALLIVVAVENHGTVLRAIIGTLTIDLRRVVRRAEKDLQ